MNNEEIQKLLDKYLEGATTVHEEQLLQNHFTQNHGTLPPQWQVYAALFGYRAQTAAQLNRTANRPRAILRATLVKWLSAAAILLLMVGVGYKQLAPPRNYAIIHGQKITSPQVVKAEAEAALDLMAETGSDPLDALDTMK